MLDPQQYYANQDMSIPMPQGNVRVDTKDPNFLQWFLDIKEGINNLKNVWRGYEQDERGVWLKTKDSEKRRIMNEEGIHWCSAILEGYLDKAVQSSNYNEDYMHHQMRQASRAIWYGLSAFYKKFGIAKMNFLVVGTMLMAKLEATYLSSRAEGIRGLITKTQSINEIRQINPNDNRGFFSGISTLFKRNNQGGDGGYQ
jgi:hypothetical protein